MADGHTALSDLSHILHTFNAYGFRINAAPKALSCFELGKGSHSLLAAGSLGLNMAHPRFAISRLPIVAKTAYLGVIIGYRAWAFVQHNCVSQR